MAVLVLTVQVVPHAVHLPRQGNVLAYASNITPVDLLTLTNQQRAASGLPALHLDSRLNASSAGKAGDMFAHDYWAHVSPSGVQPWYWFEQAGYTYTYAGENLAKDFDTSAGVMNGWMNSPEHKANILNTHYTDVGFAVENGTLQGGQTTLVVAHYGATAVTSPPVVANAATPPPTAKPAPVVTAAPVATPAVAATPLPATPAATPVPTAVPTTTPVATASLGAQLAPAPVSYGLFRPLSVSTTMTRTNLVTVLLLTGLLIVYLLTHFTAWRKRLVRVRTPKYRAAAFAQVGGLTAAILIMAIHSFGQVG